MRSSYSCAESVRSYHVVSLDTNLVALPSACISRRVAAGLRADLALRLLLVLLGAFRPSDRLTPFTLSVRWIGVVALASASALLSAITLSPSASSPHVPPSLLSAWLLSMLELAILSFGAREFGSLDVVSLPRDKNERRGLYMLFVSSTCASGLTDGTRCGSGPAAAVLPVSRIVASSIPSMQFSSIAPSGFCECCWTADAASGFNALEKVLPWVPEDESVLCAIGRESAD